MLYKSLAALSLAVLASAFHGTGYEAETYSDPNCVDTWSTKRCAKMSGKGFCAAVDECPSSKSFRCSKTREYCAGTCGTCPAKCVVPKAVEGVYGGAFPVPDGSGSLSGLEFPFFLVFEEGYATLYMYGDKSTWAETPLETPLEFGCALFIDSDEYSTIVGGDAYNTTAPFCATLTGSAQAEMYGYYYAVYDYDTTIDYSAYWALRTSAVGGSFFDAVKGAIDLSGGYGTASATFTEGQNIDPSGELVKVENVAIGSTMGDVPYYFEHTFEMYAGTESVSASFVFTEGKVCYTAPPLWNEVYPDSLAAYAGSIGAPLCLDKIA